MKPWNSGKVLVTFFLYLVPAYAETTCVVKTQSKQVVIGWLYCSFKGYFMTHNTTDLFRTSDLSLFHPQVCRNHRNYNTNMLKYKYYQWRPSNAGYVDDQDQLQSNLHCASILVDEVYVYNHGGRPIEFPRSRFVLVLVQISTTGDTYWSICTKCVLDNSDMHKRGTALYNLTRRGTKFTANQKFLTGAFKQFHPHKYESNNSYK